MNKRDSLLAQQNILKEKAESEASKQRNKMSDFAQILMAIDNIETKCSKYGQTEEDGPGKNRSSLRRPVIMHPSMNTKPKHFEITDQRVDFGIR